MKILTVVAPGGEARRGEASEALGAWNRGLDIRLRFLNIGAEERVLVLAGPPAGAAEDGLVEVEEAIRRSGPDALLLHGAGEGALAAALTGARSGIPVVRTAAGARGTGGDDAERATDRLCEVRFAAGPEGLRALEAEGLEGEPWSPGALVKALVRVVREP